MPINKSRTLKRGEPEEADTPAGDKPVAMVRGRILFRLFAIACLGSASFCFVCVANKGPIRDAFEVFFLVLAFASVTLGLFVIMFLVYAILVLVVSQRCSR